MHPKARNRSIEGTISHECLHIREWHFTAVALSQLGTESDASSARFPVHFHKSSGRPVWV